MKQGALQTCQSTKTGERLRVGEHSSGARPVVACYRRDARMVISKIAIQFTDGLDTFEAEAFDKLVLQLSQSPLNPQNIYAGQFTLSTSSSAKNDTNAYANKVSLIASFWFSNFH